MSSNPFEFVKLSNVTNYPDDEVRVKPEPMDYAYQHHQPDVKLFEGTADKSEKCGEIFSSTSGRYILICAFCKAEFNAMEEFGKHISIHHGEISCKDTKPLAVTLMEMFPKSEVNSSDSSCDEQNALSDDDEDDDEEDYDGGGVDLDDDPDDSMKSIKDDPDYEDNQGEHNDEKSESLRISCNTCNRNYKSRRGLYRHQKNTGCRQIVLPTNVDWFCIICQRQLKSKKTFKLHMRRHVPKVEPGTSQDDSEKITPTKRPIVEDPALYCDICKRYFKAKNGLMIHTDKSHCGKDDPIPIVLQGDQDFLKCKYCEELMSDLAARKEHETKHDDSHPYECRLCHKKFSTAGKKLTHIMGMHTGERPFKCSHCSNAYINRRDLARHINYGHLKIRKFQCTMCDRKCCRSTELAIHMRKHTGEKPYVCEDCGTSFATLGQLRSHQLRHTQTKNFKCEQCGRCFYSTTSLKDHQASHSDAKPFICSVCGRGFPRAKALKKHSKLHLDYKAYVCNICGKAYAQDSGLYAHKKSHGLNSTLNAHTPVSF